jgi:DNA-directed RNA polymerase subunit delta
MGGHRIESYGSDDNSYDEDGYDESQRAEILEATGDGPTDGTLMTDIPADLGLDDEDEDDEDDLRMVDGEVGQERVVDADEDDLDEDDLQDDFDDEDADDADQDADDGDLSDEEDAALRP